MLSFRIIVVAVCAFLMSFFSQNAFAAGSGSYRVETPDAGAFGMGSAFVGEADTPAAVYYNPAGINQMSRPEVSVGDAIIAPRAQMTEASNGNTVHMQNNEFNIPNFYAVVPIIPNKLSIGVGSGSYWGTGTNWGPDSPLRYATTQASIQDVDNSLVASYQVTKQWSVAASVDNDYSRIDLNASLPSLFGSSIPGMEVKGGDDAWGYRLATMFKINDQNQVGLMYRSRIDHNYTGKIAINGMNGPVYPGLGFSGSSFITNFEEKNVLPQSVVLGYSFKPTSKLTINVDLEWMDWSSTKYQTLSFSSAPLQALLGSNASTPADWHSAWSESIGTQYDVTDRFRVRLGYYHHGRVIPDATFNSELPDSNSNGYTTGLGFDITKRLTLDVAYSIEIYDTRDITNSVAANPGAGVPAGTVDGKYKEFVNIGLVSLTYKF
jgi:long-chain fatty acid transport protein